MFLKILALITAVLGVIVGINTNIASPLLQVAVFCVVMLAGALVFAWMVNVDIYGPMRIRRHGIEFAGETKWSGRSVYTIYWPWNRR